MREKLREGKLTADLNERLDAMSMSEVERSRAKAQLARAEHAAEVMARAAGGVTKLAQALIVRPIKRALATVSA